MGFKGILKTAFPFISAGLVAGGPFGIAAAAAVGHAIGVDKVDPSEEGVEVAITQAQVKDPEALAKLQEAEQTFKLQMTKLGFDNVEKLASIDAEDRANARAREIATKDNTNKILAFGVIPLTLALEAVVMFHGVAGVDGVIIGRILGTLDSATMLILSYYFGSSSGSAAKQSTINTIATTK